MPEPTCPDCGGVIVGSGGLQDVGGTHEGMVWGGNCEKCGRGFGENAAASLSGTPAPRTTPEHVCGLQGFGRGIDGINDRCPACESPAASLSGTATDRVQEIEARDRIDEQVRALRAGADALYRDGSLEPIIDESFAATLRRLADELPDLLARVRSLEAERDQLRAYLGTTTDMLRHSITAAEMDARRLAPILDAQNAWLPTLKDLWGSAPDARLDRDEPPADHPLEAPANDT